MGLENLKSAFSKIIIKEKTKLSTMESDFQSGPVHPKNDSVYNPADLSGMTSEFQSGPTHPKNDSVYNPISSAELAAKESGFQTGPVHEQNDGVYNPISSDELANKPSEFQVGPTYDKIGATPTSNNLTAPEYPSDKTPLNSDWEAVDTTSFGSDSILTTQETPVLSEYQKFNMVEDGANLFEHYTYDPRTARENFKQFFTKKTYKGTSKTKINLVGDGDSGIGGIFNTDGMEGNKYSLSFRTINTPNLDELITGGNFGQGYLAQQNFYNKFLVVQENVPSIEGMARYYEPGSGINLSNSSWYAGGDNKVAPVNDLTAGTFGQFNSQTRTVQLDGTAIQANELKDTGGWESLYSEDHTAINDGYGYPFVNRDKLRFGATNSGFRGDEPYIRKPIGGNPSDDWPIGFTRELGFMAGADDVMRVGMFLGSPAGLTHIVKSNILTLMSVYSPYGRGLNLGLGTLLATGFNGIFPGYHGGGKFLPNARPNFPFNEMGDFMPYQDSYLKVLEQFQGGVLITNHFWAADATEDSSSQLIKEDLASGDTPVLKNVNVSLGGKGGFERKDSYRGGKDPFTMAGLRTFTLPDWAESSTHGMPMYFKDLRTGTICLLRAFIEGLSENVAPSWTTTDYPGRSEPVYSYNKVERDVSFTLKFFPNTLAEEEMIYKKIRFLTGLAYPSYTAESLGYSYKMRMNPPFCEFRLGEMYGNESGGQMGFIKSLTYTIPESSPWNITRTKRRPKHITAAISYQLIGNGVPDSNSPFYGSAGSYSI